jgi:Na+/H+-dicarboxylate symporter
VPTYHLSAAITNPCISWSSALNVTGDTVVSCIIAQNVDLEDVEKLKAETKHVDAEEVSSDE